MEHAPETTGSPQLNALRTGLEGRWGVTLDADHADVVEEIFGPGGVVRREQRRARLTVGQRPERLLKTSAFGDGEGFDELDEDPPQPSAGVDSEGDPYPDEIAERLLDNYTDNANSYEFALDHGATLRWDADRPKAKWLTWNGTVWEPSPDAVIMQLARETAMRLIAEAEAEGISPGARARVNQQAGMKAMVQLAAGAPGIACSRKDWNRVGHLLNTPSGVVDLRDGSVAEHDPMLMFDRITEAGYDPDATAEAWEGYLETSLQGDDELISYVQRMAGMCLAAEIREHVFFLLHGPGGNGKSILLTTLSNILGPDLAMSLPASSLMSRPSNSGEYALAKLPHMRLAVLSEVNADDKFDEATVKKLTGGESFPVRQIRGEPFEFTPVVTALMAANHLPLVVGADEGIWRRFQRLPFTAKISKEDMDLQLPSKLKAEYDAIMAWAVRGAQEWYRNGLGSCRAVDEATAEYKTVSDPVKQFIDEQCIVGEEEVVVGFSKQIYNDYVLWAEGDDRETLNQTAFGTRLTGLGITQKRKFGQWARLGLGRRNETDQRILAMRGEVPVRPAPHVPPDPF